MSGPEKEDNMLDREGPGLRSRGSRATTPLPGIELAVRHGKIQEPPMNRNRTLRHFPLLVGLAALAGVGCSQPPSELVTQAQEAEHKAVADGAQEYAPGALGEVANAKAALEAELAVQSERWGVRRSYGQAEALAETYRREAEEAAAEANLAREAARSVTQTLIEDSRLLLMEVRGMLAAAPVGKGSAADLAALRADLDAAEAGLESARASMAVQAYLDAQASATTAREIIDGVKGALDQARGARAG